jgi:MFS family permease
MVRPLSLIGDEHHLVGVPAKSPRASGQFAGRLVGALGQDGRMAKDSAGRPRKGRFTKSGHTSHQPRYSDHQGLPPRDDYRSAAPPPPPSRYPPPRAPLPPRRDPDLYNDPYGAEQFSAPVYHGGPGEAPESGRPVTSLTKAAFTHTNRAARVVTRKVISASKADGAHESGLTALIWNQVLSYGTDAMITVALAGTVFFGASAHAQRGNVLLYLLVTMAPFAIVAPIIGPALDRLQHGRRWTMAGTAIGRGVLALIMAGHPTELLVLYPCALGSLVLSKAYAVVRAAAAPRLVPPGMTLTEANARLSIFGLASTLVLGGVVGVVIKTTGSYSLGLYLTAIGYAVCAFFAFRLPGQVDSAVEAHRHPQEPPRPRSQPRVAPMARLRSWARRGFDDHVVIALQGESALRLLSGLLTIYLAFYVESTAHGLQAALDLGAVIGAAGVGNFSGTAIGTKVKMARPEVVIVGSVAVVAGACVVVALAFGIMFAVVGMYLSAVANALCKIALDSLIQRDVVETLRSSAFARSETFLQLAWVIGAAVGVVLPSDAAGDGQIGFWVAAVVMGATAVIVVLRLRVLNRRATPRTDSRHTDSTHTAPAPPEPLNLRKTRPY